MSRPAWLQRVVEDETQRREAKAKDATRLRCEPYVGAALSSNNCGKVASWIQQEAKNRGETMSLATATAKAAVEIAEAVVRELESR